jgi:maltose phosphorylase
MLQYNTWTIEQTDWNPTQESDVQQQLTFSNDYLCQTAHFEEHYSGGNRLCTYIKGVETSILNLSAISVRLHDERLDLHEWQVEQFYRCLHKNQPILERHFVATSPKGNTLKVVAKRQLLMEKKGVMHLTYEVQSVNYRGPITILSVLRGGEDADKWYSLMNYVGDDLCWIWMQLQPMRVQLCCAMNYQLMKNNALVSQRPIKVEKQDVIGFSVTQQIAPGDTLVLHKNVAVVDSNQFAKDQLIDKAIECLIN